MQIIVTGRSNVRTRVLHLTRWHLAGAVLAWLGLSLLLSLAALRWQGVALPAAAGAATAGEPGAADRFLRENLDALATRLGEMQAKLVKLEAIGERVSGLAGVKPEERREIVKPAAAAASSGGRGGPYVPAPGAPTREQLDEALSALDERFDQHIDLFTLVESRLFEDKLAMLTVPNSKPIDAPVGSGFGMRSDPFSGRNALHTGLDFAADQGAPILAAAGGVVLSVETHAAYGQQLLLDHGNGLVTRYAHCSKILVKAGDLVKRGQHVAHVGSTGRSTGPHLHFEVLVEGVPQNPAKFLAGGPAAGRMAAARR